MLVITRHTGQSFKIDGDIEVTVVAVRGKSVRVGIRAPQTVRVAREELLASPCDRRSVRSGHELDERGANRNGQPRSLEHHDSPADRPRSRSLPTRDCERTPSKVESHYIAR